ncbi:signal recognition particle subunit SRP19/SEC65 family protein [Methanothermobacter tenebrarum]|uniref:Signal recognition particle 19 kDa protein n=1 Tax=Methanothermobacter tenebrarum TaxID=680118 RepID=A0A328PFT3_9EURY|nr:signal recognition particle subunit SRP19/SEC65 family protein [Methanothermobacter tenebrarum]MBC7101457.1 signal recognition particle subunit SRP19/SEC65 family protein [Methanobacteriales archaeon]MBC7117936.1 signal recognition particle subunit SRP19/SEC65 family protein [Methanobacteriaceae archaeon]NPV64584.1 signal recognition particle protein Srp19 [Methanobacteriaceae archaeon]RAO78685.1 signal recognition particle protein Srp19 [Methanothermobacter tenebrarum]
MRTIIWPAYLDSKKTKKEGRKIPRKHAVESPTLNEIRKAAERLKFKAKIEADKAYPSSWWERSGRVIIEHNNLKKRKLLLKISKMIKASRKKGG